MRRTRARKTVRNATCDTNNISEAVVMPLYCTDERYGSRDELHVSAQKFLNDENIICGATTYHVCFDPMWHFKRRSKSPYE